MREFLIRLIPLLDGQEDGGLVTLTTSDPQSTLNAWLTIHYEPLSTFLFKAGSSDCLHRLVSKNNPKLEILIQTSCIEPTDPRNVLNFSTRSTWLRKN